MSDSPSSVPRVPRPKETGLARFEAKPVRYSVPTRYDVQFPPPDAEHDDVDQVAFAGHYFAWVFMLFMATAGFAAFVLVPMVGLFLA